MRPTSLVLALAALAGCDPVAGPDLAVDHQPIVGGSTDGGDPAVVMMQTPGGGCTGTVVSPRVILTAAHCVSGAIEAGATNQGNVYFGTGGNDGFFASAGVADMVMFRLYEPPAFLQYDIAMMRLDEPAPADIDAVPINFAPITDEDLGLQLRTIGFGVTDGAAQTGFGTKRQIDLTLDDVTRFHIQLGDPTHNICQGDSGGPTMARFGGVEHVVGVASFGSDECRSQSSITRTDLYQAWIELVMDAWDGPCQADGTCVTDGCDNPDPDCDVCGFDGVCGSNCAAPDLDGPLGKRDGEACSDRFQCEGRVCLTAPDDDRVQYCTATCDPTAATPCEAPLSACVEQDGAYVCTYGGPTPGTQGTACLDGGDCRSGMCDLDDDICVEPCGGGLPECGSDYECRDFGATSACLLPEGGCGVAGGRDPGGAALVLLAALGWVGRRRGRRGPPRH